MKKEIQQTWQFSQAPEEVWEYLTKPELIEKWLMKTNFKPIKGQKFQFTFNAKPNTPYQGVVECEVLEILPFSRLSYTWSGSTQDKTRNYNSVVIWTLEKKGNGTELHLSHDGFSVLEDILNHSSGWNSCVIKMENLLKSAIK
ncbi:MAG TPA: SRPBCC domain-containing protein [Cyclobacteriaceae bacterium]|nr:SRPBCC domain-containing protein [Cyclobacteriaceae bacterium]